MGFQRSRLFAGTPGPSRAGLFSSHAIGVRGALALGRRFTVLGAGVSSAMVITMSLTPLMSAGTYGLCSLPLSVNVLILLPYPFTVMFSTASRYLKPVRLRSAARFFGTNGAKASPSGSKCMPKSILWVMARFPARHHSMFDEFSSVAMSPLSSTKFSLLVANSAAGRNTAPIASRVPSSFAALAFAIAQ